MSFTFRSYDLIPTLIYVLMDNICPHLGKIMHTICGASVPWQFVKSTTESAIELEVPVTTWDMEKYNQIERQIWSPESSRLTEMCIAEQIKE